MISKSRIALLALVTSVGIASPALAQTRHVYRQDVPAWSQSDYDRAASARTNSDSPALTGGGSLGGNELMDHDFQ